MWPFGLYAGLVLLLAAAILGTSALLGSRHSEPETGLPFESGIAGAGPERLRLGVRYYPLAMFFVVFDLESTFLFAWAVAARPLGWAGYGEVVIFALILLATLFYLARRGALAWAATGPERKP